MLRLFLILCILDVLLTLTSLGLGWFAEFEPTREASPGGSARLRVEIVAAIATGLIHTFVYSLVALIRRYSARVVNAYHLPSWILDQTAKNESKARRLALAGVAIVAFSLLIEVVADAARLDSAWHFGPQLMALGFTLGTFAAEYVLLATQRRLLTEVRGEVARLGSIRDGSRLAAGKYA